MDLDKMANLLNSYDANTKLASIRLKEAEVNLEKYQKVKSMRNTLDLLMEDCENKLTDLKILKQIIKKEEIAFKERRLAYISGKITEQLDYIFTEKGLRSEITCNFERNNMKLKLGLVDDSGVVRPPYLTEGKFAQQLISFSAAAACTELLGKNILYLDESFSNASQDNLEKTQKILNSHREKGFQIVLISQSSVLFNDLPRREIHLHSEDGKYVSRVEYKDFTSSEDVVY